MSSLSLAVCMGIGPIRICTLFYAIDYFDLDAGADANANDNDNAKVKESANANADAVEV